MQGKSLPRKIKEKILDLFQQGFGYCAVAKILGLNESTIKTYSLLYRSGDETSGSIPKQKNNPQGEGYFMRSPKNTRTDLNLHAWEGS